MPVLVHSAFSLLRAAVAPERWVDAAHRTGHETVILADWMNLCAALPFLEACESGGIRPILGAELAMGRESPPRPVSTDPRPSADAERFEARRTRRASPPTPQEGSRRLVLLCKDLCGYRNLAHILSALCGGLEPARASNDPLQLLGEHAEGLLALSDAPELLEGLRDVLGQEPVGALVPWSPWPSPAGEAVTRFARSLGVTAVALPEAAMLADKERATLRLLAAIRRRDLLGEGEGEGEQKLAGAHRAQPDAYRMQPTPVAWLRPLPGRTELRAHVTHDARPFRAGRDFVASCRLRRADLCPRTFIFPHVGGAEGPARLRELCLHGLASRGLSASPAASRRLENELAVIEQQGFVDYFLATARIARWARGQGIPIVGRGSGVASLVAYLLHITDVDPIRYRLFFERFLHPLRGDYPDLDIDIAADRRGEVLDYVLHAFGPDRAAMVGTYQLFRPRGAFRDAGRALGLSPESISRAARALPHAVFRQTDGAGAHTGNEPAGSAETEGRAALRHLTGDPDAGIARAARAALTLVGLPRNLGVPSGGVVLSGSPLSRLVPLERASSGVSITQFDMHGVEKIGLIKIDLLGNRVLATVAATCDALTARRTPVDLDQISHDDRVTAGLLARGATLGCFQIESPAMRSLLRQLRPGTLEGVIAALSLIRPGPASSGMKQAYVRRAHGEEEPHPIHPAIRELLSATYGLPLYEEDIMCMAAAIAGISYAEADMLRRAIAQAARLSRRDAQAARDLEELRQGFFTAARSRGRLDAAAAAWDSLVRFAAYAFCKAHAAGYGVLAYRSAYLKAHFPGPFFAALLNHHRGMYPTRVYVDEARRTGLALRPPRIDRSGAAWQWEPGEGLGTLRCGLARVRHMREQTIMRIVTAREAGPFRDLGDFVARGRPNTAEVEALVLVGACDGVWDARPRGALVWQLQRLLRRSGHRAGTARLPRGRQQGTLDLHAQPADVRTRPGDPHAQLAQHVRVRSGRPWRDISLEHRARLERRFLGTSLALHPAELWRRGDGERWKRCVSTDRLGKGGGPVRLLGIVSATRRHRRPDGEPLLFFTLEDARGLAECVLRYGGATRDLPRPRVDDFVEVRGDVTLTHGSPRVRVHGLRVLGHH